MSHPSLGFCFRSRRLLRKGGGRQKKWSSPLENLKVHRFDPPRTAAKLRELWVENVRSEERSCFQVVVEINSPENFRKMASKLCPETGNVTGSSHVSSLSQDRRVVPALLEPALYGNAKLSRCPYLCSFISLSLQL